MTDPYEDDDVDNGYGEDFDDFDDVIEWGCQYPENCVMPGEHMLGECHTAEMIVAQNGGDMTEDEALEIVKGIAGGEPSYRLLSKWTELERWQAVCTYLVKLEIEIKSHRESSAVHLGSPRDTDWSKQEI